MSDQDSKQYEPFCTAVRHETTAKGAILIIYAGTFGDGVVVQLPPEMMHQAPGVLRNLASQIEGRLQTRQRKNDPSK